MINSLLSLYKKMLGSPHTTLSVSNVFGFVCRHSFHQYLAFHLIEISITAWENFVMEDFCTFSGKKMIFCASPEQTTTFAPIEFLQSRMSIFWFVVLRVLMFLGISKNQKYHSSADIRPWPIYEPSGALRDQWGYIRREVIVVWRDSIPVNFGVPLKPQKSVSDFQPKGK